MAERIILADDSITIQKVVGLTFASEDYELAVFDNGTDALEAIKSDPPALVLADTDMPGLNGFELCETIKNSSLSVPVILLYNTYEVFDSEKAQAVGADYSSPKPFDSSDLLAQISKLISQYSTPTEIAEEEAVEELHEFEEIEELEELEPHSDTETPSEVVVSSDVDELDELDFEDEPQEEIVEEATSYMDDPVFAELGDGELVTGLEEETPDSVALEVPQELDDSLEIVEGDSPVEGGLQNAEEDLYEADENPPVAPPVAEAATPGWNMTGLNPYNTATENQETGTENSEDSLEEFEQTPEPESLGLDEHVETPETLSFADDEVAASEVDEIVEEPVIDENTAHDEISFDTVDSANSDVAESPDSLALDEEAMNEEDALYEETTFEDSAAVETEQETEEAALPEMADDAIVDDSVDEADDGDDLMAQFEAFDAHSGDPEAMVDLDESETDVLDEFAAFEAEHSFEETESEDLAAEVAEVATDPVVDESYGDASPELVHDELLTHTEMKYSESDKPVVPEIDISGIKAQIETQIKSQIDTIVREALAKALEDISAEIKQKFGS